jgi:hypothetical protein
MIESMAMLKKNGINIGVETLMYIEPRPTVMIEIILANYEDYKDKCEALIEEELKEQEPNATTIFENILDYLYDEGVSINDHISK